ncbi:hypothetical protein Csa_021887 [Cucumis sativus]|uniref:Uncharacterized protein n=1 Tax=Cucumis sativus TaxID=3659 RepID=A0A0A0LP78_CUCSA|nr:hypothetical protein Csa_021887 [Cucumis sativus]
MGLYESNLFGLRPSKFNIPARGYILHRPLSHVPIRYSGEPPMAMAPTNV